MLLLFALPATAATRCLSVDAFNTWMESHAPVDDVTVTFDVTGVNPNDFWGTKGALADLTDNTCGAGGSLALKVYGPDDPPNTAHPAGTLKQEYGYNCGPMPGGEYWAEPNASDVVFTDGSETCDVTIWINPSTFGYELVCNTGTFRGEADNGPAMPVNQVTLFALSDGSTWRIGNARSTRNEVCFEDDGTVEDTGSSGGTEGGTDTIEALEDVTVATDFPTSVYADTNDLCVEAGYSEVYLTFDLRNVPGTITRATLEVTAADDGSANGSGAEAWAVSDTSWDEDTLSWGARPGAVGSRLDRASPISPSQSYELDVSSAVSAPGVYAFALLPATTDTDGAHFRSAESGNGPKLHITWEPADESGTGEDPGGGDAGEDTDDGNTGAGDTATETPPGRTPRDRAEDSEFGMCACSGASGPEALGAVAGMLLLTRRRRR